MAYAQYRVFMCFLFFPVNEAENMRVSFSSLKLSIVLTVQQKGEKTDSQMEDYALVKQKDRTLFMANGDLINFMLPEIMLAKMF